MLDRPKTLCFLVLLSTSCIEEPASEPPHAALQLENGVTIQFIDEGDGEVTILETAPSPSTMGLIRAMSTDQHTPAELWVSIAGDDDLPVFLQDHHVLATDREITPFAVASRLDEGFREMAHSLWGGSEGYCGEDFASDFETFNPVTTTVDLVGSSSSPIYGYSNGNVKQAWVAVCNDTLLDATGRHSRIRIARRIAPTLWSALQCETPPGGSAGWCDWIYHQEAKAIHYWTTSASGYDLRVAALWAGGEHHNHYLKAGFSTDPY